MRLYFWCGYFSVFGIPFHLHSLHPVFFRFPFKYQDPLTSAGTVRFDQVSLKAGFDLQWTLGWSLNQKWITIWSSRKQPRHPEAEYPICLYDSVTYDLVKLWCWSCKQKFEAFVLVDLLFSASSFDNLPVVFTRSYPQSHKLIQKKINTLLIFQLWFHWVYDSATTPISSFYSC